jgi:HlyD family secretion protein
MASSHADVQELKPVPTLKSAPPKKSGGGWFFPILLIVLAAGGGAAWWYIHERHRATTPVVPPPRDHDQASASPGAEGGSVVTVDVVKPTKGGEARTTEQPGWLHAFEFEAIYPKVSGYLKMQKVDIGDHVKKGDLLAEIYVPEKVEAVREAEAAVAEAKAKAELARKRLEVAKETKAANEALVKARQAAMTKLVADREYYKKAYDRFYGLWRQNAIEKNVVDEAEDRRDSAIGAVEEGKAAILVAQADVNKAEAEIQQAQAEIQAAEEDVKVKEAALAEAKVWVEYTKIHSAYDGVVTHREYHIGDYIKSAFEGGAQQPMLRVARTDKMRVILQVPDNDVPYLDRGDPAVLRIVALHNKEFKGKVARMADAEDPETRTMRTEVDLENTEGLLREGMYGKVTIQLEPPSKNLRIPASCLVGQAEEGQASVWVARDGVARLVSVRIGETDGINVEILSGLDVNDDVILPTSAALTDGTPVFVMRAGTEATTESAPK